MPELSSTLLRHYLNAEYLLEPGSRRHVFNIGERPGGDFEDFLQSTGANCWAIITAWNPYSSAVSAVQNRARQAQLQSALQDQGYAYYPAVGQSPDGKWQEASLWIPGIMREQARESGIHFQQNALVYGVSGNPVELISCV